MSNLPGSTRERLRAVALEINLLAAEQVEDRSPNFINNPKTGGDEYHDSWWLSQASKIAAELPSPARKTFSIVFFR